MTMTKSHCYRCVFQSKLCSVVIVVVGKPRQKRHRVNADQKQPGPNAENYWKDYFSWNSLRVGIGV